MGAQAAVTARQVDNRSPARGGVRPWMKGAGRWVRYADDVVVLCRTRIEAERALAALRRIVSELGLSLRERKTRIVHLREGDGELDFLGFEHRWVRGRTRGSRHVTFLARWPSRQAMRRARERIRELTERKRLSRPVEEIVQELNRFLRGWGGYFRYGNSARHFDQISTYALKRLASFVAKRHGHAPGYGMSVVAYRSTNRIGLISLNGTVVAPRPFKPWTGKPNAGGEGRR